MPRHLISDAHERINEIPTVPIYYLAKTTAKGNGLCTISGKRRKSKSKTDQVRKEKASQKRKNSEETPSQRQMR